RAANRLIVSDNNHAYIAGYTFQRRHRIRRAHCHVLGDPIPARDRIEIDWGASCTGQVEAHLRAAGYQVDGGAIRALATPRLFGYAFNLLSVYFCHRRDGSLMAVPHEVNNTFGERH